MMQRPSQRFAERAIGSRKGAKGQGGPSRGAATHLPHSDRLVPMPQTSGLRIRRSAGLRCLPFERGRAPLLIPVVTSSRSELWTVDRGVTTPMLTLTLTLTSGPMEDARRTMHNAHCATDYRRWVMDDRRGTVNLASPRVSPHSDDGDQTSPRRADGGALPSKSSARAGAAL